MIKIYSLCAVYCLAFAWLLYTCKHKYSKVHVWAKSTCSALFLIISVVSNSTNTVTPALFFALLFVSMAFCFGGDVLLACANVYPHTFKKIFISGMASFMLGHLLFCVLFYMFVPFAFTDLILPMIGIVVILFCGESKLFRLKRMHMLKPVLAYTIFVSLMATLSVRMGLLLDITQPKGAFIALGGVLFLISDTLILLVYFAVKQRKFIRTLNLLTYYAGMLCFALCLAF